MVKKLLLKDTPIRDTVEGNTARQTKGFLASDLAGMAGQAQDNFFRHCLDGAGDVHMAAIDFAFGQTGWTTEQCVKPGVRHRNAAQKVEVIQIKPK